MTFYPDWVAALDGVSRGEVGAVVTQRNALDIIRELTKLRERITTLEQRPRGLQVGDGNIQTNTF